MIRAEEIHISDFRGIRDISLKFGCNNFAICGPNGTGKSGIVDALEFALTGNISRLSGTGTSGLSVKDHGPHVDCRNKPESACVTLKVHIPSINKFATITRTVKDAKHPKVEPDTPDVRSILESVALHPEFALSRRELIRYVLSEPGKRSKEVQELLRLDEVETLRTLFQKIANANDRDVKVYKQAKEAAGYALQTAMSLPQLSAAAILKTANEKRALLFLPALTNLEANSSIKDGIVSVVTSATVPSKISKVNAKADIEALKENLNSIKSAEFLSATTLIAEAMHALLIDEDLLKNASKEHLLQSALEAFDGQSCPVCETPWEPEKFREKLAEKLRQYEAATTQRKFLEDKLEPVTSIFESIKSYAQIIANYGKELNPTIDIIIFTNYINDLNSHLKSLTDFLPISAARLSLDDISKVPDELFIVLTQLETAIAALPEPTQQDAARDFLTIGQERLDAFRQASLNWKNADSKATTSRFIFDTYATATTAALESIYKNVEVAFSTLYRQVNHDDEDQFKAELKPSIGKLGFDVDFYGRGFFPPGAYHSEGHQDGMGLCLYLALMNYLAGDTFTFAVLDDVLMSVDSGHRREVSKMLREQFPKTQFILTTHDEIWLRHMKSVGLIEPKRFAHFRTWSVDLGPTEWDDRDVWDEIAELLNTNNVRASAALLRNYLEHFSKEMCQSLHAQVEYRGDAQFTLGGGLHPFY